MTTTAEKSRPKPKGRTATVVTALPQVNLLPPEVRAARGLKLLKRWLVVALVLVVALCGVTYVFAKLDENRAASELASAQAATTRLQNEQKKYAEVPRVLDQLAATTTAREIGTSTEILWSPYYQAIAAVLPTGVSIDTLTVTQATPMVAPPAAASPLQAPSIGQIQFTARSLTVPDTAAWADALNGVPGFADAWVSAATVAQDTKTNKSYYNVSATVQVNDRAYAHRFTADSSAKGKG